MITWKSELEKENLWGAKSLPSDDKFLQSWTFYYVFLFFSELVRQVDIAYETSELRAS